MSLCVHFLLLLLLLVSSVTAKIAYVTLIGAVSESRANFGYFLNALVNKKVLTDAGSEADFVVLTIPLTRETQGLVGRRELNLMKRTAFLINIGRGGTVDQTSLVRALQKKQIAGAGLDVFETEPLPNDSPLWGMENVIITAHHAGITPHYHSRAMELFLDNLARYRAGRPLRNIVNTQLGY